MVIQAAITAGVTHAPTKSLSEIHDVVARKKTNHVEIDHMKILPVRKGKALLSPKHKPGVFDYHGEREVIGQL